jgi:uncharacterized membrane protein HdeD (DUF308 family)
MSTHTTVNRETYVPSDVARAEEDRGMGWVTFAGILLLIIGTLNIIEGIAAIDNAHFFVGNAKYIAGDLNAWGWTVLCLGVVQILVGLGVMAKNQFARWTGVAALSLNAIAQLMFIPAYPFWSLAIFSIDILAIYGLCAYGGRISDRV